MNGERCSGVLMKTIREERLDNGLRILFVDESNRYFGDYHRVCIQITLVCALDALPVANTDDEAFRDRALTTLGKELKVVKRLERMGVPTAEVERVRHSMIEAFMENASSYIGRPEYPRSLVNAELKKPRTHSFYG
jgi:hypothetical protein